MIRQALLVAILSAAAALPAYAGSAPPSYAQHERLPAPAPGCLDAHNVLEVRQSTDASMVVRGRDGTLHRMDFSGSCPGVIHGSEVGLVTPDGHVCGRPGEALQVDQKTCGIQAISPIASREYAEVSRASERHFMKTLPTVNVVAESFVQERRRRLRGSPDYCFSTRAVRSWSTSPAGIVVETNPRRNGGNRFYEIETGGDCREFNSVHSVVFLSGLQNNLVCGNPGDQMVRVVPDSPTRGPAMDPRARCSIKAVYPRN